MRKLLTTGLAGLAIIAATESKPIISIGGETEAPAAVTQSSGKERMTLFYLPVVIRPGDTLSETAQRIEELTGIETTPEDIYHPKMGPSIDEVEPGTYQTLLLQKSFNFREFDEVDFDIHYKINGYFDWYDTADRTTEWNSLFSSRAKSKQN